MSELDLFQNAGDGLEAAHFGLTDEGVAYVVAAPFAKAMGYSAGDKATRMLDDGEKGHLNRVTPGGQQRVAVIYEDGIWELIFRSTLPSARAIKTRVKEILRQLRDTGVVDTRAPREMSRLELIEMARDAELGRLEAEKRAAVLEPAAKSWTELAEASGDYSLREAAQILDRDPQISTGQNRLAKYLREISWLDAGGTPFQRHVELGRLAVRASSYEHPKTHEQVVTRQVRVTAKGLHELHKRLGGSGPLLLAA